MKIIYKICNINKITFIRKTQIKQLLINNKFGLQIKFLLLLYSK